MTEPQSPFLAIGLALICGAIAYLCHRFVTSIETNDLMPLSEEMRGDQGRNFPLQGTWPFRDKYDAQFARRSYFHLLLITTKWALVFVTVLLGAVYPIVYLIKFAGR